MSDPQAEPYSYDLVPYPDKPYAQTHPDRLATIARLFGMTPPSIGECRVLEIGCGSGGNLIPMAEALPDSRFVGIDLSEAQIADGHGVVRQLGLSNIELRHLDILGVGPDFGKFHYILCHGVYSWVPKPVQERILDICASNLAEDGVAYVSYNTYPGWHLREMIRHMMRYHADRFTDPKEQVAQARALLDFLGTAAGDDEVYGKLLRRETRLLRGLPDAYLFHEHLEGVNAPIYFHEFAERLAQRRLQYIGDAQVAAMYSENLPDEVAATLKRVALGMVQMEQYMDFVVNRGFRQSLLCHEGVALDRRLRAERLEGLYVASPLKRVGPDEPAPNDAGLKFQHRSDERSITTKSPLLRAALEQLEACWPGSIAFPHLLATARERMGLPTVDTTENAARIAKVLGTSLLKCYLAGLAELRCTPSPFTTSVSERPAARASARLKAASQSGVTNCRHESVRLRDLDRHVLQHLDGTRDHTQLLAVLKALVEQGTLVVQQDGRPMASGQQSINDLAEALDESLGRLASAALLVR